MGDDLAWVVSVGHREQDFDEVLSGQHKADDVPEHKVVVVLLTHDGAVEFGLTQVVLEGEVASVGVQLRENLLHCCFHQVQVHVRPDWAARHQQSPGSDEERHVGHITVVFKAAERVLSVEEDDDGVGT